MDIDKILKRIVRLEGGVASISVGATGDRSQKELDDAINAAEPLEDGVVSAGYGLVECITGYEKICIV